MLEHIRRNPGATLEEIAKVVGLSVGTISNLVGTLEGAGQVYRDREWDRAGNRWAVCVRPVQRPVRGR